MYIISRNITSDTLLSVANGVFIRVHFPSVETGNFAIFVALKQEFTLIHFLQAFGQNHWIIVTVCFPLFIPPFLYYRRGQMMFISQHKFPKYPAFSLLRRLKFVSNLPNVYIRNRKHIICFFRATTEETKCLSKVYS